nr:CPARA_3gp436 [Cryptomonas curvata]
MSLKNQQDFNQSDNLKLRMENYRLKEKLKNFENNFQMISLIKGKFLNKNYYKILIIKLILIIKRWNNICKEFFFDDFSILFKFNQKKFLLDVIILKKKILQAISLFVKYIDLIKSLGKIVSKIYLIFIKLQKKFDYLKSFFNQILVQKLYILCIIQNNRKNLIIKSDSLNIRINKIDLLKAKIKIFTNLKFNNPEKFINLIMIKKIKKKKGIKKMHNTSKSIIQLEKLKYRLSVWVDSFLFKVSSPKYDQLQILKKLKNLTFSIKYILGDCFYCMQKTDMRVYVIFKEIKQFSKKIESLRKKIQKLHKFQLILKINKVNEKKRSKYILFFNNKTQFFLHKIKKSFMLLTQISFFEKFFYFVQLKKQTMNQNVSYKHFFFNKISKYFKLKQYKYRSDKTFSKIKNILLNNFLSIFINVCIYRASDIDKEIIILWTILKLFNFHKHRRFLFVSSLIKKNYFKLQNQHFKLKNEFNRIILTLKQKIFRFQKSNSWVRNLLLENDIKKKEVENKLHEIKSMEIDFSEILYQIKK